MSRPTDTPCLSCGGGPHYSRGLCKPCYGRAADRGLRDAYPACGAVPVPRCRAPSVAQRAGGWSVDPHPAPLPAIVTPAMVGISDEEKAGRCAAAAERLAAARLAAERALADWLKRAEVA